MPGRRANASTRRATGSTSSATTPRSAEAGQAQPAGDAADLLFREFPGATKCVVQRGHDEVLEDLEVAGSRDLRIDGDRDDLLLPGDDDAHRAAAGRALHGRGGELLLHARQVGLHLLR